MYLVPNDCKHLLRTEISQISFLKTFCCNNKGTSKVKDFQKLCNKEIYFIAHSNRTKYIKSFRLKIPLRIPYSQS